MISPILISTTTHESLTKQERKRLNNKRYRDNQKELMASLQKHLSVVYILLALSVMLNLVLLTFINY